MVPGGPPMPPTPPKWMVSQTPKIIKISDLKKVHVSSKNEPHGIPLGIPKSQKSANVPLQGALFTVPLLILVWKFHDFLTPWNLANGALAYTKHRFSLFHPIPKMSST